MANSLQDQLLKAGLVSQQKAKQTLSKKRKHKRAGAQGEGDQSQREAAKAAAKKRERDRELNRQRDAEAKRKAELVALWQLVRESRISREQGDLAYNFADGKALKRLYVNAEQQAALVCGKLAIVRQDDFYALVTSQVAERVAAYDASLVLVLNRPGADGDDDYANFKVPDDLMW